jgi:hypothetical protein
MRRQIQIISCQQAVINFKRCKKDCVTRKGFHSLFLLSVPESNDNSQAGGQPPGKDDFQSMMIACTLKNPVGDGR